MTKPIDRARAAELRRTWISKAEMWSREASKLYNLAKGGAQKYYTNRRKEAIDAEREAIKYSDLVAELDAIVGRVPDES